MDIKITSASVLHTIPMHKILCYAKSIISSNIWSINVCNLVSYKLMDMNTDHYIYMHLKWLSAVIIILLLPTTLILCSELFYYFSRCLCKFL